MKLDKKWKGEIKVLMSMEENYKNYYKANLVNKNHKIKANCWIKIH